MILEGMVVTNSFDHHFDKLPSTGLRTDPSMEHFDKSRVSGQSGTRRGRDNP
ncbi:MAG: hypothetical protein IH955_10315 [Chloroflexi bacterium]|nr:hypothetical protein [Chloroflexota bacterium]